MKKGKEEAIKDLFECCRQMEALKEKSTSSPEFLRWRKVTEELIGRIFGEESDQVRSFTAIYYSPLFLTCRMGDEAFDEAYREGLGKAGEILSSCMKEIGGKPAR